MWAGTLTSFPHRPPACDVALCRLREKVHGWWQADGLDGVGHGCWDCQLHQSHVVIHAAAVEGWVDDDPLDGDDQGSQPGPQHRPQAHSPVGRSGITVHQQWKQRRWWVGGNSPHDISRTYLLKQCAAVISHLLWTSVAPQRWSFWYWRLPTQGHSPLRAVTPPTILWVPRAGRTPQSTAEAANKKLFSSCSAHALFYGLKLTAVLLVCIVGAVGDTIALWVDLLDAGGGTTLVVFGAVYRWKTGSCDDETWWIVQLPADSAALSAVLPGGVWATITLLAEGPGIGRGSKLSSVRRSWSEGTYSEYSWTKPGSVWLRIQLRSLVTRE